MGAVFAIAFLSLAAQVRGLIGARGIQPAGDFLNAVAGQPVGAWRFWKVPTLFWFNANDATLVTLCWIGVACSAVLAVGLAPGLSAFLCWVLYLSFCSISSPFLDFQWDILLLESGLLAAVSLPWRWRPDWLRESPLQRVGRWLLAWLVFRLTFESGVVKLAWGDPTWLHLRALEYHFETQPIPHAIAWYAHQIPTWCLSLMCGLMFAVELVVPFLLVLPRRLRHAAAVTLVTFQVGILLTGNFAFFNWLSIALCLPLFDDGVWPGFVHRFFRTSHISPQVEVVPRWRWAMPALIGTFVVAATGPGVVAAFNKKMPDPLSRHLWPLRSFNSYGLFRVMTTERPEIIVEGSRDGVHWDAYEFEWKPGDVSRAPGFVAPHQPRLDWQMWFAALDQVERQRWFVNFLVRLLQGSPEVLALLEWNPFPIEPPRYVRATLYQYHFTRLEDGTTGWWKREERGLYCPPLSLRTSTD
jgi:lipase maturation factor 1